jgi:hydrogenase/urease accessory protein HupE
MILGTVAATPVALEAHAIVPTVSIAAVLVGAAAGSLLPDTDSP